MKFEFVDFVGTYNDKKCIGVGGPAIDDLQQMYMLHIHPLIRRKTICDLSHMNSSKLHIDSKNLNSIEFDVGDTFKLGNFMSWLTYSKPTTATVLCIDGRHMKFIDDEGIIEEIRISEFIARARLAND